MYSRSKGTRNYSMQLRLFFLGGGGDGGYGGAVICYRKVSTVFPKSKFRKFGPP